MALVDVYGEISPGSELILDITNQKFAPLVMELLPRGPAWDREGIILKALVSAEAVELSRVGVRSQDLERELDPAQTFELLEDWETSYGLPECEAPEGLDLRRAALQAKLLAQSGHDHSFSWWDDLLEKLGFYLHYIDHGPGIFTCLDDCADVLSDEAFVWLLAVDHLDYGEQEAVLECFVGHNALVVSFPIVHYMWTLKLILGFESFRGIACDMKGRSAVVGLNGKVFYSDTTLATWTATVSGVPVQNINSVCAVDDVLVAVGASALDAIFSTDGGKNWTSSLAFAGNTLNGISRGPEIDQVCVAVGIGGAIWRSADAGLSWASVASPTALQLLCVTSCEGTMLAAGLNGIVIRSTTNGAAPWAIIAIAGLITNVRGISGFGQIVVLVGDGGLIYRSTDTGLTWAQMVSPVAVNLYCVTGSTSGRWTAAGVGGVIVQSLDGGITWTEQNNQEGTADLRAACYHHPDGFALLAGESSNLITE